MICNRCGVVVDKFEYCWYCEAELCMRCWDKYGHCGHPEADKANKLSAEVKTWEERHAILETALKERFN